MSSAGAITNVKIKSEHRLKWTLAQLAESVPVHPDTFATWLKKLKYKKKTPGYRFFESDVKKICELLDMNFDEIIEKKKNETSKGN